MADDSPQSQSLPAEPAQPQPLPAEPPVFRFAPYRTPFERAQDRFAIEQARHQREQERALECDENNLGWATIAWMVGRADFPKGLYPF
jgi:hypothetical protein